MKLTKLHWHEALDRACMVATIVNDFLEDHPAIKSDEELSLKVNTAAHLLWEVYAEIGSREIKKAP